MKGAWATGDSDPRHLPLRVLVLVVLVLWAALGASAYLGYRQQRDDAIRQEREILGAVLDLKVEHIADWRAQLDRGAQRLARDSTLAQHVDGWLRSGRWDRHRRQAVIAHLTELRGAVPWRSLWLLDAVGEARLHLGDGARPGTALLELAGRSVAQQRALQSEMWPWDDGHSGAALTYSVPIPIEGESPPCCALLLSVDGDAFLEDVLSSWLTASPAGGELVLVRQGQGRTLLASGRGEGLRWQAVSGDPLRASATDTAVASAGAQWWERRGMAVVAAARAIPDSRAWLIGAVTQEGIYGPLRRRAVLTAGGIALLGALALVIAGLPRRRAPLPGRRVPALVSRPLAEPVLENPDSPRQGAGSEVGLPALGEINDSAPEQAFHVASEKDMLQILEAISDGLFSLDVCWRLTYVNRTAARLMGAPAAQLLGRSIWEVLPGAREMPFLRLAQEAMEGKRTGYFQQPLAPAGGWLEGAVYPHPGGISVCLRDVTERKAAQKQERLWAEVFENTGEAILITDARTRILSVNRAFTRMTGYSPEEVVGKPTGLLKSGRHARAFYQNMWGALNAQGHWQGEIWNRGKDRTVYPQWLAITAVRDEHGEVVNYVGILSDISERKAAEEHINFLAHHDVLTGLPNRALLRDRLTVALAHAQRSRQALAVLFIDLDRFKTVNDSLGHALGDQLLTEAARRLTACVREDDTVSRQGGDEFIVILGEVENAAAVVRRVTQIAESLSRPYGLDGHEVGVTPSIGVSMYPNDGKDVETLIKCADAAMYHAKEAGRNCYRFFTPDLGARAAERLALESSLRKGLSDGQFILYYQPQVDLESGEVVGVEALLRWRHPTLGLISPERFIPIAEESGLIVALGDWVLREACREHQAWSALGLPNLPVAVNVSAVQFAQGNFPETVALAISQSGMDPTFLELEITESVLLRDVEGTIETLRRLGGLSVKLSLDDFGTGYSSLSYLMRFPIDTLKVDQSFTQSIVSDPTALAITELIIALAHQLGLKVVVEGVQDSQVLNVLRASNCGHVQGYFFAPPLPADAFVRWLHDYRAARCLRPAWVERQDLLGSGM